MNDKVLKKIIKGIIVSVCILILEAAVFSFNTNATNEQQVSEVTELVASAKDAKISETEVKETKVGDKAISKNRKDTQNNNLKKADEKNKESEEIEDEIQEEENVDDKEAVVEDDIKRVYPKWQNERKKPVKICDYYIKVNKQTNTVTVYIKEDDGSLTPLKAMVCSVGREGHPTPEGKGYHTSEYYDWRLMVDNTYGRYAVRFNGSIMFHSVPYYEVKKDSLEWEDYNKLGSPASLGCIRLAVADAKWIFDNCRRGTEVEVYSGPASTDPLGTPKAIKIDEKSEYKDWDPTDLTPENPWLKPIE